MRAENGREYNFEDLILNKAADELKLDKLLLHLKSTILGHIG